MYLAALFFVAALNSAAFAVDSPEQACPALTWNAAQTLDNPVEVVREHSDARCRMLAKQMLALELRSARRIRALRTAGASDEALAAAIKKEILDNDRKLRVLWAQ